MPRIGITKNDVFEAASAIAAKGDVPTQDGIREYLGRGSRGTIHKYLHQWKQICFQRQGASVSNAVNDPNGIEALDQLVTERKALEQTIAAQLKKNEELANELITAEKNAAAAWQENKRLIKELAEFKENHNRLQAESSQYEALYHNTCAERKAAVEAIVSSKDQFIESLRSELKELNQRSLDQIKDVGYKGHDALMQEKVKAINLQEKITTLEQNTAKLKEQLIKAQTSSKPLRDEITHLKKLVQEVVTFEQLQEYEKKEQEKASRFAQEVE